MKSSRKRGLLLGLGYLLLLTALLYGFYAYEMGRLGKALKEREALRAEIETHGPWVEQAIWMPADGGAAVGRAVCAARGVLPHQRRMVRL